jgi:hypothetical protein
MDIEERTWNTAGVEDRKTGKKKEAEEMEGRRSEKRRKWQDEKTKGIAQHTIY